MTTPPPQPRATSTLASFLRESSESILDRWEQDAREFPKSAQLPRALLRDSFPELLQHIADEAELLPGATDPTEADEAARKHALQRLDLGFSLGEMVHDYALLRQAVWGVVDLSGITLDTRESALLDTVLDRTIEHAVVSYSAAQQRTLLAVNQISQAALDSEDVEALLQRLIDVFRRTAEGVDEVEMLLCDGDRLVTRASSGSVAAPDSTAANLVASDVVSDRRPVVATVHEAAEDDSAYAAELRERNLRVMYAAPLIQGHEVIGVAQMGSRTAFDFSDEHRVLFRVMSEHATMLIDRARAIARGRADAAVMRALASASTLDEALNALLTTIGEQFAWDTGAFWRHDSAADTLRFERGWHAPGQDFAAFWEPSIKRTFDRGVGLPGQVWATGSVAWITNIRDDTTFLRTAEATNADLQSAIAFPVSGENGETIGVLEFFTRRRRSAHEEGVYLTRVIARQLPDFMGRIATSERIRQSEMEMSAMQASALDAIIWMDDTGRVTAWNPAATRTFGYGADEAIGRTLADLIIPHALRAAHHRGLARYLRTGQEQYMNRRLEVPAVDKNGREFPVELVITALLGAAAPQFCGFVRDISERKASEAERQRLLEEAQQATQMRDHLLAVVSHDLRNSLNAVVVSGAMLQMAIARSGTDDRVAGRTVDTILRAANQMRQLIGDLLDVAVMQSGRLSIDLKQENVCSLISEAVDLHKPLAHDKGMVLEVRDVPDEIWINADRGRLLQVFSNLLGNAIKFGRRDDTITVRANVDADRVCMAVIDTGPGIKADILPLIFEPHWAGHVPGKGTGLGLFISRRLVEAHGGELVAESGPTGGTTFRFCLPVIQHA
jgi:PAS domain S-box-containing protein